MSFDDQATNEPDVTAIKSKVTVPAVLLIVVAILNLLAGAYNTYAGVQVMLVPPDQFQQAEAQMTAEQKREMEKLKEAGFDFQSLVKNFAVGFVVLGIIEVLCGLVTLFGGIKMMSLQSYGLAMTGAVLAAIPCISPCCLLGQIAGIWGMVVLMSQDVKSAFR
jgi:hypothetical protein